MRALDLFAGAGGWSLACQWLGIGEFGVENMTEALATRKAAGFSGYAGSVIDFRETAAYEGLIASPPCQSFSQAGKGSGRADLGLTVTKAAQMMVEGYPDWRDVVALVGDERTRLSLEPLRLLYGHNLWPFDWVALEQVPTVLPLWEVYAEILSEHGYYVWTGKMHAEQYGVPQTRTRAILIASRLHPVGMPTPTHSLYHSRSPERLDEGVEKWVSMAEALGWAPRDLVGFPRLDDGKGAVILDGTAYRARDLRPAAEPSLTLTEKARSMQRFTHMGDVYNTKGCIRSVEEPSPTLTASMDNGNFRWHERMVEPERAADVDWPMKRPSTTVVGSFHPEIQAAPGYRKAGDGPRQKVPGSVRVSVEEAGVLQSFPEDFPWQGSATKKFLQVGNAIPPLLAYHVLKEAIHGRR